MPVKLDSVTFDKLLGRQAPFATRQFDLRDVDFVSPAALVQLAAACYTLHAAGRPGTIVVEDPGLQSYLVRTGFLEVIADVATLTPKPSEALMLFYGGRRGSNPMLIEVTKITTGGALPEVLDRLVKALRHRLRYRKNDAFDIATAVSEVSQNTFDHNSGTYGFLAMQGYGKADRRFLEIGVADCGDGLRATLTRNPRNAPHALSDLAAIQYATRPGSSEHEDPTRGTGLYHLLEITYKHQGSVQIRSGNGKVRYRMDKKQGWTFSVPEMRGVQIALTLPTKVSQ